VKVRWSDDRILDENTGHKIRMEEMEISRCSSVMDTARVEPVEPLFQLRPLCSSSSSLEKKENQVRFNRLMNTGATHYVS
jgi:hypothetical protein